MSNLIKAFVIPLGIVVSMTNTIPVYGQSAESLESMNSTMAYGKSSVNDVSEIIHQTLNVINIEECKPVETNTYEASPVYVDYYYTEPVYQETIGSDTFETADVNEALNAAVEQALADYNNALAEYEAASQVIETTREIEVESTEEVADEEGNISEIVVTTTQMVTEQNFAGDVDSALARLEIAELTLNQALADLISMPEAEEISFFEDTESIEVVENEQEASLVSDLQTVQDNEFVEEPENIIEISLEDDVTNELTEATNTTPFTDVSANAWYYSSVQDCYESGLMKGTSKTRFSPSQKLTRAMAVTIIWRMEGSPSQTFSKKFKDVSSSQWYSQAITWAANKSIVHGYNDGTFKPDQYVTREQVSAMLCNYAKYRDIYTAGTKKLNQYQDGSKVSKWAQTSMKWAISNKIIQGNSSGYLKPTYSASRAEGAAMYVRMRDFILSKPISDSVFKKTIPAIGEWTNVSAFNPKGLDSVQYKLSWNKVPGASGYEFYYDFELTTNPVHTKTTTATNYTVGFNQTVNLKGKVRAYKYVNGSKIYTQWSNISYKPNSTINAEQAAKWKEYEQSWIVKKGNWEIWRYYYKSDYPNGISDDNIVKGIKGLNVPQNKAFRIYVSAPTKMPSQYGSGYEQYMEVKNMSTGKKVAYAMFSLQGNPGRQIMTYGGMGNY